MTLRSQLWKWLVNPNPRRPKRQAFRPGLESLEELCLLSSAPLHLPAPVFVPESLTASSAAASPAAVRSVYRTYLRRGPSPAELKQGLRMLAGGVTDALELRLVSSREYFLKRAKKNSVRWLTAAALDVLGHSLTPPDAQRYGALAAGGAGGRVTVARLLLQQRIIELTPIPIPQSVSTPAAPQSASPSAPPVGDLFALDPGIATTLDVASQFLYSGSNPVQTGVTPSVLDPVRVAVVRGRVIDRDGAALPGVTVSVLNHPEYGSTTTQDDGWFSLAVNGGGLLTLEYANAGFLSVQRTVNVPWQDYAVLDDVALIPLDSRVTTINLSAAIPVQVARGSVMTDEDGVRQNTLLVSQGTLASMTLPDGSTRPLTSLNVRVTEYTVGATGDEAMPGALPASSAYTYAVELSVDEALAAGATSVHFDRPLYNYVENFLGFPTGTPVPVGYYDRELARWVPSDDGRVIQIVALVGGRAEVDGDGDGDADTAAELQALGFTDPERQQLAGLYAVGQTLWRVPITHFTPFDYNWPATPPSTATFPPARPPAPARCSCNCPPEDGELDHWNQVYTPEVPIPGLIKPLRYSSEAAEGRTDDLSLEVPLSDATVPAGLKRITLMVTVGGRRFTQDFTPTASQTTTFTWDGLDAYGRQVRGTQPTLVRIGYVYDEVYELPAGGGRSFGLPSDDNGSGPPARREITLWRDYQMSLGGVDMVGQGLGGWDFADHHVYDPVGRVLYEGGSGGRSVVSSELSSIITAFAGTGNGGFSGDGGPALAAEFIWTEDLAVGPDGSVYVADYFNNRIRKIDPAGIVTTVAGGGTNEGDGGLATQAHLYSPAGITVAPDGSLYFLDGTLANLRTRIRRVSPEGILTTVAGTGEAGNTGDGGPATEAQVSGRSVHAAPDGSVYLVDTLGSRIRRIGTDGIIETVAGTGVAGFSGDGGSATAATLNFPMDLAFAPDGSFYIGDARNNRIRKVDPAGTITTYAGTGDYDGSGLGDGRLAAEAPLEFSLNEYNWHASLATGRDGALYFSGVSTRVRRIGPEGVVTTVAGGGSLFPGGDGGPATAVSLGTDPGIALGPDGSLYIGRDSKIRRVGLAQPAYSSDAVVIPSSDGSEVYQFDSRGRHLRTVDALTNVTLTSFAYDAAGRLERVTDRDGNVTRIERDASGKPTAIVAPFGQRTRLELDANGHLARVIDPAGAVTRMTYKTGGLLETLTDAQGRVTTNQYDEAGLLTRSETDAGGFTTLATTHEIDGHTVTVRTAEGLITTSRTRHLAAGGLERILTGPDGVQTISRTATDGTQTLIEADGTVATMRYGPDPRFGMLNPVVTQYTVQTPGGLTYDYAESRTVTLANPRDPLSVTRYVETTTVNGDVFTSTFDVGPRTVTTQTAEGRTSVTTFDALGHVSRVEAAGVTPVVYEYDTRGRLVRTTQGTRRATFEYGPDGLLASATDPLNQTTRYTHDAAGRIMQIERPDGEVIALDYNLSGQLTSVTPPDRPAHAFNYNDAGDVETYTPPDLGPGSEATTVDYDLDRRVTQILRPDGTTIEMDYDAEGQLQTLTTASGTTTFSYDPTTELLTGIAAPGNETLAYGYDGGLLSSETWSGTVAGSVTATLDNLFRVSEQKVNGGHAVTFEYDDDGLLTRAGALSLSRDTQNGRLTGSTLGGVTDSLGYNTLAEVTAYEAAFNGTAFFNLSDTLDAFGRITHRVETIAGVQHVLDYQYDVNGRLTEVKRDGIVTASYTHDANGNRLSVHRSGVTVNGTYDTQDRLTQYGTTTFTYTLAGELQSKTDANGVTTYDYDAVGNLRSVTLPGGDRIDYVIDGTDRRVGKKVNGTLVQGLLYDGQLRPVAELDGAGNVVSRFVYATGVNVPDYVVKGGVTYRLVTDQVGSVRLVVDTTTGAVAQRIDYDEFGRVMSDTSPGFQPFGFAGGLFDYDTGLVRFGARDYDAETGRWTAKDPIGFAGGLANLYGYVGGDAINRADWSGLYVAFLNDQGHIYRDAYYRLRRTGRGRLLCRTLERSPRRFIITQVPGLGYRTGYYHHGHPVPGFVSPPGVIDVIAIDPAFHPNVNTTKGPVQSTPERVLGHELGHAATGGHDSGPGHMANVIQNENPIMTARGQPPRTTYP